MALRQSRSDAGFVIVPVLWIVGLVAAAAMTAALFSANSIVIIRFSDDSEPFRILFWDETTGRRPGARGTSE